jgi:hypothetical protein
MDITMDTRTPLRAKRTIIDGPTDMTIIRKAYTMVAMLATTQDIALEERGIITTSAITTRATRASIHPCVLGLSVSLSGLGRLLTGHFDRQPKPLSRSLFLARVVIEFSWVTI